MNGGPGRAVRGGALVGLGAVLAGSLVLAVGLGLVKWVVDETASPGSLLSVLLVAGGLALLVGGTLGATRGRPVGVRALGGLGAVGLAGLVAIVVGPAVAVNHVPRPSIGDAPDAVGLEHEDLRLRTPDGVELAAWYVPSTNGAAVVLLHGAGSTRSNVLTQAAVLAGHGYGVLLLDARGHGESGGRSMDFGWHGDDDVAAAVAHLEGRADVSADRIGVVGMSMGGEEAIGAAAAHPAIRAVVAEGATARNAADEAWLSDAYGLRGAFQEVLERLQDRVTDLLAAAEVPIALRDAVARSDARFLLITAGEVAAEGHAAAHIASAAPDRVDVWTVPGADHTGGLATDPEGWEARVVGFLDEVLLDRVPTGGPGSGG